MPYADAVYYKEVYGGSVIPEDELAKNLDKASRQVDTLTFCRIKGVGWSHLTPFQQEQVRISVCLLAEFLFENADELETMLSGYQINGVSMSFSGGMNTENIQGVVIRLDIYAELQKTGLCDRRLSR